MSFEKPNLKTVLSSISALKSTNKEYSLYEVLVQLKLSERLHLLLQPAVEEILIGEAISEAKIQVTTEELQRESDAVRAALGLHQAADTLKFLQHRGVTVAEFEQLVERHLLKRKLVHEVTEAQIEPYFYRHRENFDRAEIAQFVVADADLAHELAEQIAEGESTFAELARQYSGDERTPSDSALSGVIARKQLPPPIRNAVFQAQQGEVVGPINTDRGHHLILIQRLLLGELTPELRGSIRDTLFSQWLEDRKRERNFSFPLLEHLRSETNAP